MAYKKMTSNKMSKEEWEQAYTQKYLEQIADSLMQLHDRREKLATEWQKPWANTDNFNQMNGLTEKTYQGRNGLNLWLKAYLEGYQDPRWVTYNQIKDEGGNVRSGEHGTLIKFFSDTRKVDVRDEKGNLVYDENGKVLQKTEKTKPKIFFATVFNLEQCENIPQESKLSQPVVIPKLDHVERVERAEHFLKACGAPISYDGGNRAFYKPDTDDVHLPPVDLFDSPSDYYHTAFHEVTHWTGAKSRLNRFAKPATKGSVEYAREEFVADLGAHLLTRDFNLVGNSDMEKLMGYLSSWYKKISPEDQTNPATFRNEVIKALELGMESQNFLNQSVREFEKTHPEDIKMFKDRIELNIRNDEQMKFAVDNMAVLDPETQKLFITYEHDVTLFKGLIDDYEDVFRKYTVIQSSKNQSLNADDKAVTENVSENINPTSEEIKEELEKEPNAPDAVIVRSTKDEPMEQNESLTQNNQNLSSSVNTFSTETQQSVNSIPLESNKDIYLNHVKNEILNAKAQSWIHPVKKTKFNSKGGIYTQFELDNNKVFIRDSDQWFRIMSQTCTKNFKDPRWATENFIINNEGRVKNGELGLVMARGKILFNLEQCEGFPKTSDLSKPFLPLDFKKQKLNVDYHKKAECIISNIISEDKVYIGGNQPSYNIGINKFALPQKEYFKSTEEYYHSVMHEIVHWTARNVINRTENRSNEEMIADIGSIMLCKQLNPTLDSKIS
jgi:antirestriction protein ArdC